MRVKEGKSAGGWGGLSERGRNIIMYYANSKTLRVLAFTILAGAFFVYYHHYTVGSLPQNTSTQIQINDSGRITSVGLSLNEVQTFLLKQIPKSAEGERQELKEAQKNAGVETQAGGESEMSSDYMFEDKCCKKEKGVTWRHPVMQPSHGSFLKNLNFSNYTQKDREFLQDHTKIMIKRTDLITKMCKSRPQLATSRPLHLLWYTNHDPNIILCPIYRASLTPQMMELFNKIHVTEVDPSERTRVFTSGLRVLVVRDPLIRILYIYLDKIATRKPCSDYFEKLQKMIVARYRKKKKKQKLPRYPAFHEFVQYVLDSTRSLHSAEDWMTKAECWTPYWAQCNVCAADYDIVLTAETLEKDEKFLASVTNMKTYKDHSSKSLQSTDNNKILSQSDIKDYLRQLDVQQMNLLYQHYILDNEIFAYKSTKKKHLYLAHD
ncbi:uncharacterized protein LOC121880060 isoform X2 [Homarus americanus]|uniref:uncharacterized protein LOC121880060 isoform X2 n=1 Tax=Homarus americanus TaxID=6706 RepID=UPI001C44B9C1|nr:uncharacterized protein LOC121880060 isoform X2 [Homarus americanus]